MKILIYTLFFCLPLVAMEPKQNEDKKQDIEAQTDCCQPKDKKLRQECTRFKVAAISGATSLLATGITALTILMVKHSQPPQ